MCDAAECARATAVLCWLCCYGMLYPASIRYALVTGTLQLSAHAAGSCWLMLRCRPQRLFALPVLQLLQIRLRILSCSCYGQLADAPA
jgi:hypothetical protein